MRAGWIISAIAHAVLTALVLASHPSPLQAIDNRPVIVDLVRPDEVGRPAEAAAEAAPAADDGLIRAPEISDGARETPQSPSGRSATAAAAPRPGPPLDLPSMRAADRGPDKSSAGVPADISVVPSPADTPQGSDRADASAAAAPDSAARGSPAVDAPKPADPKSDSRWYAALAEVPVIVTAEPPAPNAGRVHEEVALVKAHLKTCWKLSDGTGSDTAAVFRVFLRPDGTLAKDPMLLIAPPPSSGMRLVLEVPRALRQCQPYGFLPAAKYQDWKVLDLHISVGEMAGG